MSSLARRTAQMMAAAITSVEAKRSRWNCPCSLAMALFISPMPHSLGEDEAKVFHREHGNQSRRRMRVVSSCRNTGRDSRCRDELRYASRLRRNCAASHSDSTT